MFLILKGTSLKYQLQNSNNRGRDGGNIEICLFLRFKVFLKKVIFLFFICLILILFLMFLSCFDVIMLKLNLKK
jgi:hypothetical protein